MHFFFSNCYFSFDGSSCRQALTDAAKSWQKDLFRYYDNLSLPSSPYSSWMIQRHAAKLWFTYVAYINEHTCKNLLQFWEVQRKFTFSEIKSGEMIIIITVSSSWLLNKTIKRSWRVLWSCVAHRHISDTKLSRGFQHKFAFLTFRLLAAVAWSLLRQEEVTRHCVCRCKVQAEAF